MIGHIFLLLSEPQSNLTEKSRLQKFSVELIVLFHLLSKQSDFTEKVIDIMFMID